MSVWKPHPPSPYCTSSLALAPEHDDLSANKPWPLHTGDCGLLTASRGPCVARLCGSVLKHGGSAINQKGVTVVLLSSSMRLLMMCAERAELDKAESLLLLLGSYPLKSHCGPGLVFKTSKSPQLHFSAYGVCACLDLHVHAFFLLWLLLFFWTMQSLFTTTFKK